MLIQSSTIHPFLTANRLIRLAFVGLLSASPIVAIADTPPVAAAPIRIHLLAKTRPLTAILKEITEGSGIAFMLADDLGKEKITATLEGKTWTEATKTFLQPYNYMVEAHPDGSWKSVHILGKNGDGAEARQTAPRKTAELKNAKGHPVPTLLRKLPTEAVTPVTLPLATLKGMKKGQKITLELPTGSQTLVHDNRFNHRNGDTTWVGYLENEGSSYRALITIGRSGPMGNLMTPEGRYQIVSESGQTYLVDTHLAGLTPGSMIADQVSPNTPSQVGAQVTNPSASAERTTNKAAALPSLASRQAGSGIQSKIDLLVVYSKGLAQADTRINHLVALTNQAFQDSQINAQVRVVYRKALDYTENNDNEQALSDLSAAKPPFDKIPDLRRQYGADLVTYIRPLHANTQGGCGIAWVNGIDGGTLSPDWAYSVVSDGYDQEGASIYCGEQTLAHELGHNLGNVHDRAFTSAAGAFPYSYAWGVEGSFGTIMSYHQPGLFLFASPLLGDACKGQACGYAEGNPNAADNTRTINQTAPIVSRFKPSVIPDQ